MDLKLQEKLEFPKKNQCQVIYQDSCDHYYYCFTFILYFILKGFMLVSGE